MLPWPLAVKCWLVLISLADLPKNTRGTRRVCDSYGHRTEKGPAGRRAEDGLEKGIPCPEASRTPEGGWNGGRDLKRPSYARPDTKAGHPDLT